MNSPSPEVWCAESDFQMQSPIYDVNFSNNISMTQVMVNERETELDSTFNLLTINLKYKSLHNSIDW